MVKCVNQHVRNELCLAVAGLHFLVYLHSNPRVPPSTAAAAKKCGAPTLVDPHLPWESSVGQLGRFIEVGGVARE
jgi:hypothetical protein